MAESVSLAMLVVLESLTPLERAVFVLGDVFGYGHAEIAEMIDREPAAVRQLAHRARAHVQARRPRFPPTPPPGPSWSPDSGTPAPAVTWPR